MVHTYNILLTHEKEGNPAICNIMDREGIMLRQTEKDKYCVWNQYCLYVESQTTTNQTHRYREQMSGCQWRGVGWAKWEKGVLSYKCPALR